jgi:transcriptional regulator with XRE-family HTH domain
MPSESGRAELAGTLVRSARLRAGLSQAALAARSQIPASVLSAIERGRRQPTVPTLDRILRSCGYTVGLTVDETVPVDWSRAAPERHAAVLVDLLGVVDMLPPRPHPAPTVVRLDATRRAG